MVRVRDSECTWEVVVDPLVVWVNKHAESLPRFPISRQLLPLELVMESEAQVLMDIRHTQWHSDAVLEVIHQPLLQVLVCLSIGVTIEADSTHRLLQRCQHRFGWFVLQKSFEVAVESKIWTLSDFIKVSVKIQVPNLLRLWILFFLFYVKVRSMYLARVLAQIVKHRPRLLLCFSHFHVRVEILLHLRVVLVFLFLMVLVHRWVRALQALIQIKLCSIIIYLIRYV